MNTKLSFSLLFIPLFIILSGCDPTPAMKKEISDLQSEIDNNRKVSLRILAEGSDLYLQKVNLQTDVSNLQAQALYLKAHANPIQYVYTNDPVKYILSVRLSQSHFTFNIMTHIKDGANAITFDIPVDKQLYDTVSPGTQIVDQFRVGSLILNGSFGNWTMIVNSKRTSL